MLHFMGDGYQFVTRTFLLLLNSDFISYLSKISYLKIKKIKIKITGFKGTLSIIDSTVISLKVFKNFG